MKKIAVILFLLLGVLVNAQDFTGLKFLIYPGGKSNSERISNYEKAKFYKKILKGFGAEVLVIDNRENKLPLSQTAAIANQNNIDFVHAILSEGFLEMYSENYSFAIHNSFKGFEVEEAAELILDGIAHSNRIENKYLFANNENDFSRDFFVGLNSPAIISVGTNNKFKAEANKAANKDYQKNEVWGFVRALINFFETRTFRRGIVAGFVRDKNEKIDNSPGDDQENFKPINNIKITLKPVNKVYIGDFNNNGFFYFDSLKSGQYKIIYEAGSYAIDSAEIIVASNQTTFADRLLEKDFTIPPSVFNHLPNDTTQLTDTESSITVVFSIPMDQESAEDAFSIEPEIDGNIEWENEDHILKFTPEKALRTSQKYVVKIDTAAKSKNNINLPEVQEFSFITKEHHAYINMTSPDSASDSLITTASITIEFNKSMDADETEDAFEISPDVDGHFLWSDDFTTMTFVPDEAYKTSREYTVSIYDDAETQNGLELGYDYNFNFVTRSSHIHPQINAALPGSLSDTVYINSNIVVDFTEPMKREAVQESFKIQPEMEGEFEWNDDNTKMIFVPAKLLTPGTDYKITLLNSAENKYGIKLIENSEFNFRTNSRGRLQLLKTYPNKNQKDISSLPKMKLEFNYPVAVETLGQNISFYNSGGKKIELTNFSTENKEEKFIVYFEPVEILVNDAEYNLLLSKEIKDDLNISLLDNISISFKTEPAAVFNGNIVEGFEEINKWIKIDSNKSTTGIEKSKTYFEKSGDKKISGEFAGKIVYEFNRERAVLKLEKSQPVKLSNGVSEAGIWINGDLSGNMLYVRLLADNSESFEIPIDTLDWSGWKFKKFSLSNFAANDVSLKSFLIKRTPNGEARGEIFLDDLQILKTVENKTAEEIIPNEFSLEQNFPNPFNPATTISFKIPTPSTVTLEVLNILGQKVRSLIHKENYNAGTWSVEWDGKSDYGEFMPSGVYLYKIKTSDFTEVKKMILIK